MNIDKLIGDPGTTKILAVMPNALTYRVHGKEYRFTRRVAQCTVDMAQFRGVDPSGDPFTLADAAALRDEIVRRYNAHAALLGACEAALDAVDGSYYGGTEGLRPTLKGILTAAIKQAKEKE